MKILLVLAFFITSTFAFISETSYNALTCSAPKVWTHIAAESSVTNWTDNVSSIAPKYDGFTEVRKQKYTYVPRTQVGSTYYFDLHYVKFSCLSCSTPDTPFPLDDDNSTYPSYWAQSDIDASNKSSQCTNDLGGIIETATISCSVQKRCKVKNAPPPCDANQTQESDGTCKNNPCTDDIDCDGIPDNADDDIDGDGIPNASDDDIDGDGIPNASDNNSGDGCGIGRTYNNATETCSCSNGYPETYNYSTNNWECQVPKCSPYDGILPLYVQNVSRTYCASLSNSVLGFSSSYHTTDGLSCCYSDTVKAQDDDCPTNSIRDKNGICQSIGVNEPNTDLNNSDSTNPYNPPPSDSTPTTQNPDGTYTESGSGETTDPTGNCLPNYIWDNQKQKCLLFLPSTNEGNFTGVLDGNGTVTDTNDTNFTNQATSDGGQVESYKPGEFDGVIDNMFKAGNKEQKDFIESQADTVKGLFGQYFAVDLPLPTGGPCACEDYTMNVAIAGKSYIKKFTICEYLDVILEAFKYVLRFFVMYLIVLRIREIV
ncbi:hypothetical protein [Sulfurovum sp.]|uniref:hypothetical protein n=1 Tax=Sulfurovum sp. TaxID=1969726 RepID=UPI002867F6F3|nr:hypothetical protein [Sulfurovum sp.]